MEFPMGLFLVLFAKKYFCGICGMVFPKTEAIVAKGFIF